MLPLASGHAFGSLPLCAISLRSLHRDVGRAPEHIPADTHRTGTSRRRVSPLSGLGLSTRARPVLISRQARGLSSGELGAAEQGELSLLGQSDVN